MRGLASPFQEMASWSRARVAATYSKERSRRRASSRSASEYCWSRSGRGIAFFETSKSSTLRNSRPLARCIVMTTGLPRPAASRSTARISTPCCARPLTTASRW